ncbi:alpha/beta fold hydrolase [Actinocorallia populi]|uniref:alpha/beta fold hydrolase n=1 Tax=Actinocorallia populi TaxID=2079200 RepID=UPI000D08DA39|nr:alpha/beta fold hydrolase [Actinocorallia populi]
MATYVLVPGFWLGAWAWDAVAAELRGQGHEVLPVTLTGLAERASEASPEVGVDTHAQDILDVIGDRSGVVLVGHSGASLPVTAVADRIPERLARVVYVDTAPLPSGMAQIDFQEPEEQAAVRAAVGDGFTIPVPDFADAGFTGEQRAHVLAHATPEPFGAATQPLVRPEERPALPKTMICCTIPLAAVRSMIGTAPVFAELAGPEWTFLELPTGHWPMITEPARLAAMC